MKEIKIPKMPTDETNNALQAALDAVQKRCKARTITVSEIYHALTIIRDKLNIPACHMDGVRVICDIHAQRFPGAYKRNGRPESTWFVAEFRRGQWVVTDISRLYCTDGTRWCSVHLTPEAEKAIIDAHSYF